MELLHCRNQACQLDQKTIMVGFTVLKSSKGIKAIKQPKSVPPSIPSPFLRTTFPSFPLSIPSFQLIYPCSSISLLFSDHCFLSSHKTHTQNLVCVQCLSIIFSSITAFSLSFPFDFRHFKFQKATGKLPWNLMKKDNIQIQQRK